MNGPPGVTEDSVGRPVDVQEFGRFVRRIMRAYGNRVADGDIAALGDLAALRTDLDSTIEQAVATLRAEPHGHSWQRIADELGISKTSAQRLYGHVGGARQPGGQPTHRR